MLGAGGRPLFGGIGGPGRVVGGLGGPAGNGPYLASQQVSGSHFFYAASLGIQIIDPRETNKLHYVVSRSIDREGC